MKIRVPFSSPPVPLAPGRPLPAVQASAVLQEAVGCSRFSLWTCRSISQNSSVLHEEEDERSCSESETQLSQRLSAPHLGEVRQAGLLSSRF